MKEANKISFRCYYVFTFYPNTGGIHVKRGDYSYFFPKLGENWTKNPEIIDSFQYF